VLTGHAQLGDEGSEVAALGAGTWRVEGVYTRRPGPIRVQVGGGLGELLLAVVLLGLLVLAEVAELVFPAGAAVAGVVAAEAAGGARGASGVAMVMPATISGTKTSWAMRR